MSNELSLPVADKELDCSARIRLSPAVRIAPTSARRSSADIRSGDKGFGAEEMSCMRPFAINNDKRTVDVKSENTSEFRDLSRWREIIRTTALHSTVENMAAGINTGREAVQECESAAWRYRTGRHTKRVIDGRRVPPYVNPHKCVKREW